MSVDNSEEYLQISEDWRHRDVLTWQTPVKVATIAGGSLTLAYTALAQEPAIQLILLLTACVFVSVLTVALFQNLFYQTGSTKSLSLILQGETNKIPKIKDRRAISPAEVGITPMGFLKIMFTSFLGSTILFFLCAAISGSLLYLAFYPI